MKKAQKYWLIQANPRLDSGVAWMFAVRATGEDGVKAKFKRWTVRNRKRFSLITTLGKIEDDPDYRRWMKMVDITDKRRSVFALGRRNWSVFRV